MFLFRDADYGDCLFESLLGWKSEIMAFLFS